MGESFIRDNQQNSAMNTDMKVLARVCNNNPLFKVKIIQRSNPNDSDMFQTVYTVINFLRSTDFLFLK